MQVVAYFKMPDMADMTAYTKSVIFILGLCSRHNM